MSSPGVAPGLTLKTFATPANVVDFPNDQANQERLNQLWNDNVAGFLTASQYGDLWDLVNYGPRPAFYNPLTTSTPANAALAPIPWNAFPGRLQALFPTQSANWNQWADTGNIPQVTEDLCNGPISPTPFGPSGPRGWQDEYCEWSVKRDPATNEILSVMFTSENPEYWLSLWHVDPNAVLELYRSLVNPNVTLDDLSLKDSAGGFVTDPSNGNQRVYNPLSKWNSGTQTLANSGGAAHLTSSPNTLGAEFDLAAAATIPRVDGNGQPVTAAQPLVCCAKYGQAGRHSDPTIGQAVNSTVNASGQRVLATLTNPPGLYMQTPDWTIFTSAVIPNASGFASSCWKVVRGRLADPALQNDIDRILHATFTIPPGYKASDLLVNGQPLQYGSQIASAITMKLSATAFQTTGEAQTGVSCTVGNNNPAPSVSSIQPLNVFQAYRALEMATNELPLSVPILAFRIAQGSVADNVAVLLNVNPPTPPQSVKITVEGGGVSIQVTGLATAPGNIQVLVATVTVDSNAAPGPRGIVVNIPGMPSIPQPALGLLLVSGAAASFNSVTRVAKPRLRTGRA